MPGTILLDDLRDSVQNQLGDYARGLMSSAQQAVQPVTSALGTLSAPTGPDPNQILQELQQHAQQAAAAAQQQAQPALQVLGGAQQAAGGALTQLGGTAQQTRDQVAQQLQDHVDSLTQGAQNAVQSLATPPPPPAAPVLGGPPPDDTTPATVGQGQSNFITSLQGLAQRAAAKTGIDPNAMLAIAANETGWGQSSNAQQQNNLFSLQGDGSNGSRWASYKSPQDSFDAFINLVSSAPRYAQAWADRGNAGKFVDDLRNAGYVVDEPGYPAQGWVDQVKSIYDHLPTAAQGAVNAVQGAGQQVLGAARGALDTAQTAMNQSQFGDPQLTADEAYAACGPAAAVRFAERFGRNPTLREATDLAKKVGWTSGGGMAGITSEQQLLKNMGVDTHIVAPDWDAIAKEAQTGNPVTISTAGHYFFADGYNPQTGAFHVGRSGLDLVHGNEWMTPAQMENLMGRAQGALFADNPAVPASSTAPASLGGTSGTQNAPITMGAYQSAKAPLVVGDQSENQAPTPIQSAQDVLGGAASAVGGAIGGAASALGTAAQGALAQATAPVQLQPGQQSARDQVGQVAADVQQAAQGVLGAAQDANRQTPGTSAVNAVAPVLGGAASDLGTAARGAVDATVPVLGAAASDLGTQADAFARSPIGQRLLQASMENAQFGPTLIPPGSLSLYRDVMQVKNDWLEQNNPLNNLPGARPEPGHEGDITPGGLIAGLTTGIAQQFTDPMMLALLGPTSGLAEAGTGALSGAVSRIVGPQLAERLAPGAVKVLGTIAQKFSQGAIVGGLQNALFEAEKKTSTPESVGQALVVGAGLGGVIDVGAAPVMAVVRRLGQVLLDNAPQISEALRSRQPAEANVNAALGGVPEMVARARGEAAPAPEASAAEQAGAAERPTANPYDLPRSAPEANAAPLSTEQVLSHLEQLDQLHTQNDARIAELQNQVAVGGAEATPADRAELVRLQADQAQLDAAHDSIWNVAGSGGDVYAWPTAEAGVPLQGGLDAGAAQATPGLAPENAPPPGTRGETAASLPGAPGAAQPAAFAESAQPELTGFRAPSSEDVPAVTRQTVRGVEPGAPRDIGEVVSNPHLLNEAGPGETPMTTEERRAHQDTLEQRYQANQDRLAVIDEQLRNPTQKPDRPPWAAGYTNDNLVEIARQHGQSAYEPLWWEKAGLDAGSGEVRLDVGQSGIRGTGTREPTPAELRAERNTLVLEQRHLQAASNQQATAPETARFARRTAPAELPFAGGGAQDPGAQLAQEVVTRKGRIASDENQVVATDAASSVTGRGIVNPAEVVREAPSAATARLMPNLSAIGKDMPETIAQIQKSAEDNPALWEHYRQGTITFDSLKNDLANRVGMTVDDWNKTKVGQAFNDQEMVALQAAMIEEQARQTDMAKFILSKGGVDELTPEELAYSMSHLTRAQTLAAVAKGAGSTVARSLNARKVSFDRQLASSITAANELKAAQRVKAQAARVATRAGDLIDRAVATDREKAVAVARARDAGAPKNIVDQIAAAYDELDRYNAMSLHEKAEVFDKLAQQRADAAAARKARVRGAPEELLSALQAELKAEQDNFAKRKNTWETMAFLAEKAPDVAAEKRAGFRGGLYIEQQRKSAQLALKNADQEMNRAFDSEMQRRGKQGEKAQKLLNSMGGVEVTKDVLKNYLAALNDPDPMVAAKFLQSTASMSNWKRATVVRLAGLVSSPITQMVNIGGNVSGAMMEVPTRALVVGIDALRAAATGGERQANAGEILPMLKAYGPGFLGQWDNAVRVLKTGLTPEQLADPTKIRGRFSPSEKLNTVVEAPLRMLGAADQLFRGGALAAHSMRVATRQAMREGFSGAQINGRAASIMKNLEDYPELAQEAQDAAARQVFQERRAGLGGGNKPLPDVAEFGVKQFLPFYQTPMNITAQGAAMSPFGFSAALQSARKAGGMATGTALERSVQGRETLLAEERAARAIIGSAILGGGLALGGAGMLTGSYPIDPREASTLPQGWRPWSLRVTSPVDQNTYYFPLQNLGPMGFPMAMAAILTDPQHRDKTLADPDEQLNAVTAIGRYVLDNTFLQGLSDLVNTLHDPKTYAQKFGESLSASYGPYSSLGREFQRIAGVATRNPHNGFVGLAESLEANYPGLSGNVPEATTPLGEPRTQGATGLARAVPYRYDMERDTPLLSSLREAGVGIPPQQKSLNFAGGHIDLSEDEQDALKRARGETIKQYVGAWTNNPQFQAQPREARNEALRALMRDAVQISDNQFLGQIPKADMTRRWKAKEIPDPYYLGEVGAAA